MNFKQKLHTILNSILFKFSFVYFLLFITFNNNGAYPFWHYIAKYPTILLHKFIPWFGKNILQINYTIKTGPGGSGDTTYDYLLIAFIFSTALIASIIWHLYSTKNNSKLKYWLNTAIRYYLALMLFGYGIVKIIKLQFPYPNFYRLTETYGESSPMGLAWTFLGFSEGYNIFMGIIEIATLFLVFRRTATLGALITLATASNIMAVNYCYDIPVKITSTHLVIMSLFLLQKDAKTLFKLFVLGKSAKLEKLKQFKFHKAWGNKFLYILKILIIGYTIIFSSYNALEATSRRGKYAKKPPLYGLYKTNFFQINKDTIAPIENHNKRWRYLSIERPGFAIIKRMNGKRYGYKTNIDTIAKTIVLKRYKDTTQKYTIHYTKNDSIFTMRSFFEKDSIYLHAKHLTPKDFLLTNRKFNWIQEYPYNR